VRGKKARGGGWGEGAGVLLLRVVARLGNVFIHFDLKSQYTEGTVSHASPELGVVVLLGPKQGSYDWQP
jgi:hypothetical protein